MNTLLFVLSVGVCLAVGYYHRRGIIDRAREQNKPYATDIESYQPDASAAVTRASAFYLTHEPRVIMAMSVVLFLLLSFVHEWVQESMQIHGDIHSALLRGPPEACEYSPPVWWSSSSLTIDREHECQHYHDRVHRLPIANPMTALSHLVTSIVIEPWLQATNAIGLALRSLVMQQSLFTQVLVFASIVIVTVITLQVCLVNACNPDGLLGRCCLAFALSRTHRPRSSRVRYVPSTPRIEEVEW